MGRAFACPGRSGKARKDSCMMMKENGAPFASNRPAGEPGGGLSESLRALPVTVALVLINIAIFLLLNQDGELFGRGLMSGFFVRYAGEWHRLLTAMFLHADINHLAGNMLWLACGGNLLERAMGHGRFFCLYMLAGLSGNLTTLVYEAVSRDYFFSLGASGATFGLVGALVAMRLKKDHRVRRIGAVELIWLLILLFYNGSLSSGVNLWAHLGGLLCGLFFGLCLGMGRRSGKSL